MTTARESSVRRSVVAYLRSLAPAVCYRSNPASPYATAGDPDLFICIGGQLIACEIKRPGWKPTEAWRQTAQARRLEAWSRSGAIVMVVTRCDQQFKQAMEALLDGAKT